MGRGVAFTSFEVNLILENLDLSAKEMQVLFEMNDCVRSKKSISRKIEKLRSDGYITPENNNKKIDRSDDGWGKGF